MDKDNSGTLSIEEIKEAFRKNNLTEEELNLLFRNLDFNDDGEINYTEFLAATVDRKQALNCANLKFAFHHFDSDNSGYLTHASLAECFRREGKHFTDDEIKKMLEQVNPKKEGKISFDEFCDFMNQMIKT